MKVVIGGPILRKMPEIVMEVEVEFKVKVKVKVEAERHS